MARPSYTDEQVAAIEAQIRTAALAVFAREGYSHFSLRAVARELSLTPAALYRYVASKDELLCELRAEGFRRLAAKFETIAGSDQPPRARAEGILVTYLAFAREEPHLYCLMYELDQQVAPEADTVRAMRERAFGFGLRVAQDFVAASGAGIAPLTLVHLWWAALHGLAALDLAGQLDMGREREALVPPLVALLIDPQYLHAAAPP